MSRFALGLNAGNNGNDAFTKILLHMDGANAGTVFPDDNAYGLAHTWTAHSATTDTGTKKFGSASLNCGAAAGYIDTPDSADFNLGSGDWTADCWFNRQGGDGTTRGMFSQANAAGSVFSVFVAFLITNAIRVAVQTSGTSPTLTGATAITTIGWHHLAAVRSANVLTLYLDGIADASGAITGTVIDSTDSFAVGRTGSAAFAWNGFIDEFRLSVGIARWTANFTPPASPYS